MRFWGRCLVDILKILLWQGELNPRVRCAFGNVFFQQEGGGRRENTNWEFYGNIVKIPPCISRKRVTYCVNIKKTLGGWKGTNLTKFQKMVKVLIADFGLGQNKTDSFAIALQPLYRIFISFSAQNKQHLNCMKSSFATLQFINQLKKLNVTSEHHSETILISILIDRGKGNHERI